MFYHNGCVFVMGGQTVSFLGNPFYNDVWKSCDDGESWESLGNAPWPARAGIAYTSFNGNMIVAGGCHGSSIGDGRLFYNDVWSSPDGETWTELTSNASWSARSGARLVVFQQKLILLAGEVGFTPDTQLGDIWISNDGADWTLLTASPAFSKRSGHGVVVARDELFVIAGWNDNTCLHDLYSSTDGISWTMRSNTSWGCASDSCGKFDFWPVVVNDTQILTLGGSNAYSTFGKLWADTWLLSLSPEVSV
jgi:N-acetylneuraminic acid mutarotase